MLDPAASDAMIDAAERLIEQHIAPHRAPMRRLLATLHPLEAIALLGYLIDQTLDRLPSDERADMLKALYDELMEPDVDA